MMDHDHDHATAVKGLIKGRGSDTRASVDRMKERGVEVRAVSYRVGFAVCY